MTRLQVRILSNIGSFAQISPKQAFKYTTLLHIQKRPKMVKCQIILLLANRLKKGLTATMVQIPTPTFYKYT